MYGPARAAKAEQNLLYRHDKPKEPTREGPLSFVLFVSPFTSVSSSNSQQGPPLSSLSDIDIPGNSRGGAGAGNQDRKEVADH